MTKRKIDYWVIPPNADGEFVASMEHVKGLGRTRFALKSISSGLMASQLAIPVTSATPSSHSEKRGVDTMNNPFEFMHPVGRNR